MFLLGQVSVGLLCLFISPRERERESELIWSTQGPEDEEPENGDEQARNFRAQAADEKVLWRKLTKQVSARANVPGKSERLGTV